MLGVNNELFVYIPFILKSNPLDVLIGTHKVNDEINEVDFERYASNQFIPIIITPLHRQSCNCHIIKMFLSTFIVLNLFILCATANDRYFVISKDSNKDNVNEILHRQGVNIDTKYQPTWQSLDSRPLPSWYDEAKIGIFIHWGVFSVPSFGSEWFWNNWIDEKGSDKYRKFMEDRYPPKFTYQDFARDFTAEFFNASQWSEMFKASGAKYVVLTSKHHEGYTLWPSKYSFSWNSMDVGPQRDLIGELSTAIRKSTDLRFGLYHSMYEWYNPLYLADKRNNFTTNQFVVDKTFPELLELVHNYNPEIIWSDGDWEAPDVYWKSKEFLAWLYNDSPVKDTVVVNDRWGQNIPCHHGGFYTCTDRYNPGVLLPYKWENALTIDKQSWGFRRNAVLAEYLSLSELVKELVTTVSCGGNLLMNVGPTKDGIISPIFEERLRGMGNWLKINGEAIYNSRPWIVQNDTLANGVWYTQSADKNRIYAILLEWPGSNNELQLGSLKISKDSRVFLLGHTTELKWKSTDHASILLPLEAHKGQPAWVIKIQKA